MRVTKQSIGVWLVLTLVVAAVFLFARTLFTPRRGPAAPTAAPTRALPSTATPTLAHVRATGAPALLPGVTDSSTPTAVPTVEPSPTSTPSPQPVPTETTAPQLAQMPFILQPDSLNYVPAVTHPDSGCGWVGFAGQVLDSAGNGVTGQVIYVTGVLDGLPVDLISLSRADTIYGPGGFEVFLANHLPASDGPLQVQLFDLQGSPLSDPSPVQAPSNCGGNLVLMNFQAAYPVDKIFLPLSQD